MGELLLPGVAISVAVILFEGGLSLKDNRFRVGIVDSNRNAILEAKMNDIDAYHKNVL